MPVNIVLPDEFIDLADDCGAYDFLPTPIMHNLIDIAGTLINGLSSDEYALRDYEKTATVTPNGNNSDLTYNQYGEAEPYTNAHPAMQPGANTSFQLIHTDSGRVYRVTIEHISN